ncbi:hypothetical protein AB4156_20810 [Cupriavidus sp. 2MCAB6]|uniref:hypothetical protein n=1 Tax=Cupriavidus sp. 2MCAB6 TaxID=3232981 RepID=UPI003F8F2352
MHIFAKIPQQNTDSSDSNPLVRKLLFPAVAVATTCRIYVAATERGFRDLRLNALRAAKVAVRRHGASTLPMDAFRFAQEYLYQYANQCVAREGMVARHG